VKRSGVVLEPRDVFISYSSRDKTIADAVCALLERDGLRCWIAPRDVSPGRHYAGRIKEAIQNSRLMVVVLSSHSNVSPHVLREVERAVHYGVGILPFRIEDIQPSDELEYFLSTVHWLDALTPPREEQIEVLSRCARRLLGQEVAWAGAAEAAGTPKQGAGAAVVAAGPSLLRQWIGRDRGLQITLAVATLLPLIIDFVFHLHIAPPWPDRLAVVLLTGIVNFLIVAGVHLVGRGEKWERLMRSLKRGAIGAGVFGVAFLAMRSAFVWDAPTPHDQDVGGFILRPSIQAWLAVEEETLQDALIDYKSDPRNIWVLWTVVVARVSLLIAWLGLSSCLTVVAAVMSILLGIEARWRGLQGGEPELAEGLA
jgi:TIR domain